MQMKRYIAITPAKDEEQILPLLIESMARQTVKPVRWIVIDDGSTDATPGLLDDAAKKHPWIQPYHLDRSRVRKRGGSSIVMQHLPAQVWRDVDFILRLDADLSFEPEFVELLMAEFERDPRLGIAGATLLERHGGRLRVFKIPNFHTHGATKMYSRSCFQAIGGLEAGPGWDTIDEARAMMLGYRTWSFSHVTAIHHRPLGGADGSWRVLAAGGRAAYHAGYSPLFLAARALRRAFLPPYLVGGILLGVGYAQAYFRGESVTAEPELIKFVRKQQLRRLLLLKSLWA
jgi:biofilm PGA synthesis N-glycosyltransferase PgaC